MMKRLRFSQEYYEDINAEEVYADPICDDIIQVMNKHDMDTKSESDLILF